MGGPKSYLGSPWCSESGTAILMINLITVDFKCSNHSTKGLKPLVGTLCVFISLNAA
jgi:hypothetical protein